jgi:carbamoyltransferase
MKIVGSYIGAHDVGFSLIENNQILACYTEERFSRIKSAYAAGAFPSHSFEAIQKDFDFDIKDPNVKFVVAKPFIHHKHHEIVNVLKNKSIKLIGHHYSHACGAYYTSGFNDNTLVVSYDGGDIGDDNWTELNISNYQKYNWFNNLNDNQAVSYVVKNGKLIEVGERLKHGSIANMWYLMCYIFGLTPLKDEGKIMGLAAQGKFDHKIHSILNFFVKNDMIKATCTIENKFKQLLHGLNQEDALDLKRNLAYNLQYITENTILNHIKSLYDQYGPFDNICLAGGVFANVKLNQKINEYLPFKNIWVYPAMGDEGLSLGSAIAYGVELGEFTNRRIKNVFFGKKHSENDIQKDINNFSSKFGKNIVEEKLDFDNVANYLVDGKVVGIFDGATEYGPRALGSRSIVVEPTRLETHAYINKRLKRDEIMPFAPIIMEEHIEDICHVYKSKNTAEFMTLCYTVREEWANKIPAVINFHDNTARPQVVNKDRHSLFHKILSKFNEKTNIPVLMNTSFNGHGEPIINSPNEALSHLSEGTIDLLIINNKIYKLV